MTIAAKNYFPFDSVADVLAKWGKEIKWQANGISWLTPYGTSEIIFVPGVFTTLDGMQIAGHVESRHFLPEDNEEPMTALRCGNEYWAEGHALWRLDHSVKRGVYSRFWHFVKTWLARLRYYRRHTFSPEKLRN